MRDLSQTLGFPNRPTGSSADVQSHLFGFRMHRESSFWERLRADTERGPGTRCRRRADPVASQSDAEILSEREIIRIPCEWAYHPSYRCARDWCIRGDWPEDIREPTPGP